MKYIKLFMLATLAVAFASCSDDESWNSNADVTVAMQQEEMKVSEAKGLFNVPIAVTGERNANIMVTVEFASESANGAVEDKNYIVTQKTCVISPDQTTGYIEIKTVDDDDINENRLFTVKIVDVQGAKVSGNETTTVTLKDNDSAFYEKLGGKWSMVFQSAYDDEPTSWDVTITTVDEENPYYEKYMFVTGMMGYAWTEAVLEYSYDKATNTGVLQFVPGTLFAEGVNFGSIGVKDVYLYGMSAAGKPVNAPLVGTWGSDFKSMTFDPTVSAAGVFFYIDGGYTWDKGTIESMTKK